jgi:hypothetical protein
MDFLKALLLFGIIGYVSGHVFPQGDGAFYVSYIAAILGLVGAGVGAYGSIKGGQQAADAANAAASGLQNESFGYQLQGDPLFGGFKFETLNQLGLPGGQEALVSPYEEIANRLGGINGFGHSQRDDFEKAGNIAGQSMLSGWLPFPGMDGIQNEHLIEAVGWTGDVLRGGKINFSDIIAFTEMAREAVPGWEARQNAGEFPIEIFHTINRLRAFTERQAALGRISNRPGEPGQELLYYQDNILRMIETQLGTVGETIESISMQQADYDVAFAELEKSFNPDAVMNTFKARRDAEEAIGSLTGDIASFASGNGMSGGQNQFGNFLTENIERGNADAREDILRQSTVAGFNPGRALSELAQDRSLQLQNVPFQAQEQGATLLTLLQAILAPAQANALAGSNAVVGNAATNAQLASAQSLAAAQLIADGGVSQGNGIAGAGNAIGGGLIAAGSIINNNRGPGAAPPLVNTGSNTSGSP